MKPSRCPICDSPETETVLALEAMPLFSHVLHATRRQALETERAPLQLDRCLDCGFIYNAIFEPQRLRYSPGYENDLSVSPRFRRYATDLASELVQRYDLKGKDIIEIGCGNGHFLKLICDMGKNRGVGFDPSYDPQRASADRSRGTVNIVPDVYSQRYGHYRADMVCCRQALEHIHDPLGFLRQLRSTLDSRDGGVVMFEVPNAGHTFFRGAVWDILYEHCNYFTEESLQALFLAAGFQPLRIDERYDGQFLTIEARCISDAEGPLGEAAITIPDMADSLADFQSSFREIVNSWQRRIALWARQHRRVVVWGAGTKGATFLNVLGLFHDTVEYVVDIHPRKQGKFVPGTAQEIIPPASLAWYQPDVVIVMNPTYSQEIREMTYTYATGVTFVAASDPLCIVPVSHDFR